MEIIMALIPLILLSIFLFADSVTGGSRAVCPTEPIKVVEGEDVLLPCFLDPPLDLSRYTLDWTTVVDNKRVVDVYVYRDGRDYLDPVADPYRGRTTINHEDLTTGILTLKISSANLSDSGSHKCFVPRLETSCEVHLIVEEKETKTEVSSTTGPPGEEVPETDDHDAVKRAAVWKTVLPVVVVVVLLILLVAAFLLWKCGVIEKCKQMLKGERQQGYEGPRGVELQ